MERPPFPRRAYAVLARVSPSYPPLPGRFLRVTHPFATLLTPEGAFAFDLHVLGMPPAFNLSQDQTLRLNLLANRFANPFKREHQRLKWNRAMMLISSWHFATIRAPAQVTCSHLVRELPALCRRAGLSDYQKPETTASPCFCFSPPLTEFGDGAANYTAWMGAVKPFSKPSDGDALDGVSPSGSAHYRGLRRHVNSYRVRISRRPGIMHKFNRMAAPHGRSAACRPAPPAADRRSVRADPCRPHGRR